MIHHFDLISDLYLDDAEALDWSLKPTSLFCIIAGNIASDRGLLYRSLKHLASYYKKVFFIDGLLEHSARLDDLAKSYQEIEEITERLDNVVYLQDRIVVSEGMAIMGTNGWWDFKFNPDQAFSESIDWFLNFPGATMELATEIINASVSDAEYIKSSIVKLQRHVDVKNILIVSNSVPLYDIVKHDHNVSGDLRASIVGNSMMQAALAADTERKIKTWCFGHYNQSIDTFYNHTRFVSNPQGRLGSTFYQTVYNPRRLIC